MMRLTAACGVTPGAFVTALARWRRIVLRLHPCCLLCKLCGGLLAVAVKLPEGVRVKSAAAAETLVASGTFVALFAITGTVLLDLF